MRMTLNGFSEDIGQFWNSFKWQSECLDPNRPGWLPTWIPTLEEKACQFGMYANQGTPPNPSAPHIAAPQSTAQMTNPSLWTPETAAQQTRVNYINETNQAIDTYLTETTARQQAENERTGMLMLVAAIAVVGLIVISKR